MNVETLSDVLADLGLSWWQASLIAVGAGAVAGKGATFAWWGCKKAWAGAGSVVSWLTPKHSELAAMLLAEITNDPTAIVEGSRLKCRKVVVRVGPFEVITNGKDDATSHLSEREKAAVKKAASRRMDAITAMENESYRQILIDSLRD